MADNSCKGCTKRKVGCHSTCVIYLAWKSKVDEKNRKRRETIRTYSDGYYHT